MLIQTSIYVYSLYEIYDIVKHADNTRPKDN